MDDCPTSVARERVNLTSQAGGSRAEARLQRARGRQVASSHRLHYAAIGATDEAPEWIAPVYHGIAGLPGRGIGGSREERGSATPPLHDALLLIDHKDRW
jgi:hypothetical protein